jgi:hypothetical protein
VVGAGSAQERLMEIVAHRELISQALQNGDVAREHVIERHGIAAAAVVGLSRADWWRDQ